jgi:two-component system chemotaxis response regulator CheB
MSRRRPAARPPLPYDVLAIGASWGGVEMLRRLVAELPPSWRLPVVIVQHQHPGSGRALERILAKGTRLTVRDVEDKDRLETGHVYIAPANYHLLLEDDGCFSLSLEAPVKYCRPAVDVTFASLARVLQHRCIGLVLTGANDDGADGIRMIKAAGGHTLAQSPASAEAPAMPAAAIATGMVDHVLEPAQIVPHLLRLLADGIGNAEHTDR